MQISAKIAPRCCLNGAKENHPSVHIYESVSDGWKQVLSTMTNATSWYLADKGPVLSIAISGTTVYGVGADNAIYKQDFESTPDSSRYEARLE